MGPVVPGSEVVIGYQALDCLLSVIAGLEALSEAVHTVEPVHTDNDGKSNYEGKGGECEEVVVVEGEACQLANKVNTLSGIRKEAAEVDLSNYPWELL